MSSLPKNYVALVAGTLASIAGGFMYNKSRKEHRSHYYDSNKTPADSLINESQSIGSNRNDKKCADDKTLATKQDPINSIKTRGTNEKILQDDSNIESFKQNDETPQDHHQNENKKSYFSNWFSSSKEKEVTESLIKKDEYEDSKTTNESEINSGKSNLLIWFEGRKNSKEEEEPHLPSDKTPCKEDTKEENISLKSSWWGSTKNKDAISSSNENKKMNPTPTSLEHKLEESIPKKSKITEDPINSSPQENNESKSEDKITNSEIKFESTSSDMKESKSFLSNILGSNKNDEDIFLSSEKELLKDAKTIDELDLEEKNAI